MLKIVPFDDWFLVSTSGGSIIGINGNTDEKFSWTLHESCINDVVKIDSNTIATCSIDGIKTWDLQNGKMIQHLTNEKKSTFLSMTYSNGYLVGGTELMGQDAEIHIWKLNNNTFELDRSFIDSHRDDVTYLQFNHDSTYLISGSTDGYVNVFNMLENEEDEALHQTINYTSVHTCHFITPNRIGILSHMETFMIHDLNDTNYEDDQLAKINEFGDLRQIFNCQYIIDVDPRGYCAFGSNNDKKLCLIPFDPPMEKFQLDKMVSFPNGHDEEVVRDMKLFNGNVLTCGEDGKVKLWQLPYEIATFTISHDTRSLISKPKEKQSKSKHKSKSKSKSKKDRKFKPY